MKNIGAFLKKYPIRWTFSVLYIIPVVLLCIGCVWVGISALKQPATDRNFYWGLLVLLLVLMVVFLIARAQALPKYYFELYENGLNLVYPKNKLPVETYLFEDISEIWLFSVNNNRTPNYLVFRTNANKYIVIPPKFSGSNDLIKKVLERYVQAQNPIQQRALVHGERLTFPALVADAVIALQSEKALLPYLEKSQKESVSLDRLSLFDGKMAYALTDISMAGIDSVSGNVIVKTIDGKILYSRNYLSLCNADLFVRLVNDLVAQKDQITPATDIKI